MQDHLWMKNSIRSHALQRPDGTGYLTVLCKALDVGMQPRAGDFLCDPGTRGLIGKRLSR